MQPIVTSSFLEYLMIPKEIEVYCHKLPIPQFHNENCAEIISQFHGFVFFAHEYCMFKTHMMHI
jgi:hypothetical protein